MRITFILPGSSGEPSGGPKVVFEYANGLVARGHQVTIVSSPVSQKSPPLNMIAKAFLRFPQRKIDKSYRPDSWFKLDERVEMKWVPHLTSNYIPSSDVVVATAWKTAEWVVGYDSSKGQKYYLIQGQETWDESEERVMHTWKLPLNKIVISRWLNKIATDLGERAEYIPNGLDFLSFYLDIPIKLRNPYKVTMLYHDLPLKGSADGLTAIDITKKEIPNLEVTLFGIPKRPAKLPQWIKYHQNPKQSTIRELYNDSAIFIAPSLKEGWGLPASEAMMCGAALVGTDIGGHQEFAKSMETALLSQSNDPVALAQNVIRLINDQELRIKLATLGNDKIREFTWERAVNAFEYLVLEKISYDKEFVR